MTETLDHLIALYRTHGEKIPDRQPGDLVFYEFGTPKLDPEVLKSMWDKVGRPSETKRYFDMIEINTMNYWTIMPVWLEKALRERVGL